MTVSVDTTSTTTDGRQSTTRRGLVLAILVSCQLMLALDVTVMNVALPRVQHDLHFTPTGLSWVINAYTLVFGGLLLLGGRAGDLFGRRRLFIGGIALFTVASLVGGLAPTAGVLLAARVAQGLGAAAAGPSTLALITTTFTEPQQRIRALAIFSGVTTGGFAIGLIVGGLLTELTSWRAVLFINLPVGIAVTVLASAFLREPARHPGRLDLPGAVTATASTAALVYGFIRAAADGWGDTGTITSLAAGVVLLAVFLLVEVRAAQPLMPLHLFTNRDRAAAYLNFFLGPMAMMSSFFFLSQFLQDVRGFSPLATGFAFLPLAVLLFAMTRLIPRLLPRFGPKPIALVGTALMAGGLLWLTRLTASSTYFADLLGPLALLGLGGGLAFSPLNIVIMGTVRPQDAGAAGGVLQTMQNVGATLGLAVLVTVFGAGSRHAAAGGADAAHALVGGMTPAFTVAVAFAAVSFVVALTFRRVRQGG
ncbi:MAG TPA: MFS transporter [Pseudonocardiaceae bacterium]|nr:MFS transporter [Pseudonocardiaceae bacterium]